MRISLYRQLRRSLSLAVVGALAVALTACTGRGGGQLPPDNDLGFTGPASFGFSFSCEDKGGLNPQTGQLHIQLSYTDHGRNLLGSSFSIHGIADTIDPVLESMVCQQPQPPPENQLIFLGRYRLTSSAPSGFPPTCSANRHHAVCRFEVIVRDNDRNRAPSTGDFFSIKLSSTTTTPCASYPPELTCSQLPAGTVLYARFGTLSSGNLTVD